MFSVKQEIQSNTAFHGVRFALFGFDPLEQDEVRSRLVGGGGVDVGQYGPNCTHVIVDKLVYDDPVCVAARRDGKILVNSHWVHHSLDAGAPVDASAMYRPVKDFSGIQGAKNLVMCLTGYVRHDREDIMLMASLMGAQFSKPLHPGKVTHLICYKFEGEKYDLAKKTGIIKLVNHYWLEDCLKAWELLPEENYNRSSYEMEMEAVAAKDSEEETDDIDVRNSTRRNSRTSPLGIHNKLPAGIHGSPVLEQRALHVNRTEDLSNSVATNKEECRPDHTLNYVHVTEVDEQAARSSGLNAQNVSVSSPKKNLLSFTSGSKMSPDFDGSKHGKLTYKRKTLRKSGLPLNSAELGGNANGCITEHRGEDLASEAVHITPTKEHDMEKQSLQDQGSNDLLSHKRKMDFHSDISPGNLKSQKLGSSPSKTTNAAHTLTLANASNGTSISASINHPSSHLEVISVPASISKNSCSEKKLQEHSTDVSTALASQTLGAENQQQGVVTLSDENARFSPKLNQALAADKSSSKSPRMKSVGQKTLGSRPRPKMGSSANQKGSICLTVTPGFESPLHQNGEIPSGSVKSAGANRPEMPDLQVGGSNCQQNDNVLQLADTTGNINTMDDETEAPLELETVENNDLRSKEDEQPHPADEGASMKLHFGKEQGNTKMSTKRKKNVASKARKKPASTVLGVLEPNVLVDRAENEGRQSNKKKVPSSNSSMDADKENQPVHNDRNTSNSGKGIGKSTAKSAKIRTCNDPKKAVVVAEKSEAIHVEKQPEWFILSGHRLQRKEFQKIIRRLKGRLCRDSHHWSYQATHFIVPDPVRRTEKFFAAAASGSWILKTDYLSASDQAGKLLPEEPYEWHKVGLSEDGAINLEAPRKWRLLKERTGHGAFYGMRVIIYGECIAPPLDTLKRVVKAGDGAVLATAPPYTKFLNAGVDFAIVSPGMPRVDMWVQEFLRHKIPCILSDYLVEYVCKPGYSLDKHVQYNTHDWASTSFANLASRSEEVVQILENPPSTSADDASCRVCGSTDRGDVMLICGNESGSAGCGAGTHIDCCDPPLEEVPEGDWFCRECTNTAVSAKKKGSKSKRR